MAQTSQFNRITLGLASEQPCLCINMEDKSKPKIYNLNSNNLRFSFWTVVTMAGLCVNIRSMLSNFWWERQIRKLILADNQGVRISTMRCLPTNKWQQHCYTVVCKINRGCFMGRKSQIYFIFIFSAKKWGKKLLIANLFFTARGGSNKNWHEVISAAKSFDNW